MALLVFRIDGFELVTCEFELVTREAELVSGISELILVYKKS